MKRSKIHIDVFLHEQSIADVNKVMNKLQFRGLQNIYHLNGTNHISLTLYDKINLSDKIKKIDNFHEIQYFILRTHPQQEIADAIADHDYFKAFALCSSTYDYLGKRILIKHINKNNLPIKVNDIEGLQVDDVINKLYYDYELIDESTRNDMRIVNKIRIDFIHYNLSRVIRKEELQHIYENIDKIKISLDVLQEIDERL